MIAPLVLLFSIAITVGGCARAGNNSGSDGGLSDASGTTVDASCVAVSCDMPPPATCDGTMLRSYTNAGTCADGCVYTSTETACAAPINGTPTCTSGACGVVCNPGFQLSSGSCVVGTLTWTVEPTGTALLRDVWGTGANDIYVVGEGIIRHSIDGGQTWPAVLTGTGGNLDLFGVWGSAHDVYMVGAGVILHTGNGGTTWQNEVGSFGGAQLYGIWGTGTDVYASGEEVGNSLWLASANRGPWLSNSNAGQNVVSGIWGTSTNDIYAVIHNANGGSIIHTTDGSTWTTQKTTAQGLNKIWGDGAGNVFASGDAGTIFHTSNGGQTWIAQTTGTTVELMGIWGTGADVFVVGIAGTILHTVDGGQTWVAVPSQTSELLSGIWGVGNDIYAVGGDLGGNGTIVHGHF